MGIWWYIQTGVIKFNNKIYQEERSLSVDFYYSIYHSHDEKLAGLKMLEVFLCDTLGWQNSR